MRSTFYAPRRGVLLILILSLLAMFGLIALTFVLIVGQAQRSAKNVENADRVVDPPQKLLNEAVMQCLRGSKNDLSVMGPHSLLEDMYGPPVYLPTSVYSGGDIYAPIIPASVPLPLLGAFTPVCGGQLLELTTLRTNINTYITNVGNAITFKNRNGVIYSTTENPATYANIKNAWTTAVTTLQNQLPFCLGGCVITIKGLPNSSRIVSFNPVNGNPQILNVWGSNYATLLATTKEVTVNGLAFNGKGFGLNPATGNLDATDPPVTGKALALLPNAWENRYPLGGANEDYDAADYQNILLSAQTIDATTNQIKTVPSLHRPSLVSYWKTQDTSLLTTSCSAANFSANKVILRPMGKDFATNSPNPNFTGSNPTVAAGTYDPTATSANPWDVDNDGDGVPDSVWVDLGMPVRKAKDGRLYKPLFAILCLDMDGRLNLNAHGNYEQAHGGNGFYAVSGAFAGGNASALLQRGQGYGPAEISLSQTVGGPITDTEYRQLFVGLSGTAGRLGRLTAPAVCNAPALAIAQNKWFNYPGAFPTATGAFGTPPDVNGVCAIGLDQAGHPLYDFATSGSAIQNSYPYGVKLAASDHKGNIGVIPAGVMEQNPFGPDELERLLRPFDKDATSLPRRIAALAPTLATPGVGRFTVTTESWDVPTCGTRNLFEKLQTVSGGAILPNNTDVMQLLFPPEILAGLKMNINRPFGNGVDDDGNGVIDENGEKRPIDPTETFGAIPTYSSDGSPLPNASQPQGNFSGAASATTTPVVTAPAASSADATKWYKWPYAAQNGLQARQLTARYIYVLSMLLCNRDVSVPTSATTLRWQAILGTTAAPTNDDIARYLAQWAVNVVDFMDRDSIMTPFEYDTDPFTAAGWRVDGDISAASADNSAAYRGLVWGCERPELLITETLAFHDRRTEDLNTELNGHLTTEASPNNDNDFDQKLKPIGSLFFELFNPNMSEASAPVSGEFYSGTVGNLGVNIADHRGGTPTWRIIIVDPMSANGSNDPDDPTAANRPTIQRSIYFTDISALNMANIVDDTERFYPNATSSSSIAPILPGRYMVVGPGDAPVSGEYITKIGTSSTTDFRSITLKPNANPETQNQFNISHNRNASNDLPTGVPNIDNPTAVVINTPQHLNISEPYDNYAAKGSGLGTYNEATGGYATPADAPFDTANELKNTGTTFNYRVLYLQRLANPLLAYNAVTNPYLTVDSMPVDLTAFNGVTDFAANKDPSDNGSLTNVYFETRERGDTNAASQEKNLWKQEQLTKSNAKLRNSAGGNIVTTGPIFKLKLTHSFGYINAQFSNSTNPDAIPSTPTGDLTTSTFPWLNWNNRPYASAAELMLVPTLSSSRLLAYSPASPGLYYNYVTGAVDPYSPTSISQIPYPHLPNFFNSSPSSTPGGPELHRIFDYLTVPSLFADASIQANPTNAEVAGDPALGAAYQHPFHPPFNWIPNYREPGKINLNTIYDEKVFQGLMNHLGGSTEPTWNEFFQSRQADGTSTLFENSTPPLPTELSRPFRSSLSGTLVPITAGTDLEVDPSILRVRTKTITTTKSLFEQQSTTNQYDNTDRNPFFRYQGLSRLGNLVTTRSNVYSIWITVGYFEVIPQAVDALHPDGYQLGQELGSDTGEIERHRSFYIIDRSLPVGFIRGEDWNAEKAIILNRYIE